MNVMEYNILKWHRIEVFKNNWTHFGSISRYPKFFKDELGRVYLSGTITGGMPQEGEKERSQICHLPVGFRPLYATHFSVASSSRNEDGACAVPAILVIRPDGEVFAKNYDSGWMSLDGAIFFTTED